MSHKIKAKTKVIERFHIPGQDGYSEFWRRNKSPVEKLELARLLLSLRKVASYVGRNVGTIVWSGMDFKHGIALDPSSVMGKYPVPPSKTDRIIGLTIRKAYEKVEWSERFKELAQAQMELPPHYAYKFDLYFDICENIYLDCLSNRSVLACYTEKTRISEIRERHDVASHPPTVNELFYIWWGMAADRSGTKYKEEYTDTSVRGFSKRTSLERFYKEPLALLNSIVDLLIYECPKIHGVTERGNFRLNLYLSIWPRLFEYIKFWPTDSTDPFLKKVKIGENLLKLEDEDQESEKPTSLIFANEIEQSLRKNTPVFTDRVKDAVQNADDVVRVQGNDIVMHAKNRIDKKLLHNLQFVIKTAAQRKTAHNRGLKTGKIDRRRLFRAPTTGTIFQLKKDDFDLVNDIILLVDATGSMSAPSRWEQIEKVYQSLFSAIKMYNKNARVFAYNEVKSVCRLTEIYLNDRFFTVLPHGKTASGEAIIATAMALKTGHKKPFIIHLTDGASNWGCGVDNAIEFCKKKRINLLTLGMGCSESNKASLRKEYGKLVQFVDNPDTLPGVFRTLLNHSKWD
ncbi:Uncharacterized protein dnm_089620 [Desulfonema magnum]|uniref:VWFA domain-containing protein n=2 Tax=Desulfonema magnum TaxID=45655 RepID=A0A975BW83_9BACT|nr:Uncharacterized protein dnm_089620 [Desulfonema magnum]